MAGREASNVAQIFSHSDADIHRTLKVYDKALRILCAAFDAADVAARWEPPHDIDDGLRETVRWYRETA